MLYQLSKALKFYGENTILDNVNFKVEENEKIAIVGRNGAGKTTLLKVINGEVELESGEVYKSNQTKVGYLSQSVFEDTNQTVLQAFDEVFSTIKSFEQEVRKIEERLAYDSSEEALSLYAKKMEEFERLGGFNYQTEMKMLITKFGFDESILNMEIGSLSGGQKTRIAFIKLLLLKPDILLLDEPTNHLDLDTINWLEGYLKKYQGSIVLVSHDRRFIDKVCTSVCEVRNGNLKVYTGDYTNYLNQRKIEREKQHSAYVNQQKEINRIEAQVEKFRYKASKASFAQSKLKYLDNMDIIEDVDSLGKTFKVNFESAIRGGQQVLEMEDLAIGYDEVLAKVSLTIMRGQRIAILGKNGCGKTTLLKTISGEIPKLGGDYLLGHQIAIGYYTQDHSDLNPVNTVIDELWNAYPNLTQTEVRTILGTFLFSKDDVFKNVSQLSGGEKGRLQLAKLMMQHDNFLVLDEPTNHLDLESKEVLEDSLIDFDGTIFFVSHDRYFINKVGTALLVFEDDGVKFYEYGYDQYLLALEQEQKQVVEKVVKKKTSYINYEREIKKIETRIDELEALINQLKEEQFKEEVYSDSVKMKTIETKINDAQVEIEEKMLLWEEYTLNIEG